MRELSLLEWKAQREAVLAEPLEERAPPLVERQPAAPRQAEPEAQPLLSVA